MSQETLIPSGTSTSSESSSDNGALQVIAPLKQDILSGYFRPGDKLKMAQLKKRYGVGVGPLREALSQLLVEQLVVVENQRGFYVHPVSQAELMDIYQTRAHIESICVGLAIENGDDDWEADIVAAAHRLNKAGTLADKPPEELQVWEARHHAFHTAVVAGCQSPTLMDVRRSLYQRASRYRNLWLQHNMPESTVFDANQKEHKALVESLLDRKIEHARELVYHHILSPSQTLQGKLEQLL